MHSKRRALFTFHCYSDEFGPEHPVRVNHADTLRKTIAELTEKAGGTEALESSLPGPANYSVREGANHTVNGAYRNGPVESVHAGRGTDLTDVFGYRRMSNPDIRKICDKAALGLCQYLLRRRDLDEETRMLFLRLDFWNRPHGWSLTEETSSIKYTAVL